MLTSNENFKENEIELGRHLSITFVCFQYVCF